MEVILILLAIIWVVVPMAAKKKQQAAKAEAERQRAARQQAPAPRHAPAPMRTAPLTPSMRPVQSSVQAPEEGSGSYEGVSGTVLEGEPAHDVQPGLTMATSTLREAQSSITHTVTASSESGHAHEETSATGIVQDCPPEKAPVQPAAQGGRTAGESAFVWDVERARSGLVMAEILGPCLALRD